MAVGVFGLQVAYKLNRTELLSTDDTHGWFGTYGSVSRMDFSNDSMGAQPRGSVNIKFKGAATGNSNYGWFGGGYTGFGGSSTPTSLVDRIDFSNDSATSLSRGVIRSRRALAATGNFNFGWFGGGFSTVSPFSGNISVVDRIDFSNDSLSASPRGLLNVARFSLAATGNSNFGWFGGGSAGPIPAPVAVSTVDRIDFSNDSATASPRGNLSLEMSNLAATGNSNYGWFGGSGSLVNRIDFSNDSATALPRGLLGSSRPVATGNSNYGWFSGGYNPVTIDRIDFSNDLSAASPRGPLQAFTDVATSGRATGPSIKLQKAGNFGWFGGGLTPSPVITVSSTQRIDFSNDSVSSSPRGPLSLARHVLTATGNSNFGWFGGGSPGPLSTVDRIDFSNDSVSASPRGPLSLARATLAATGNSNYGWFGGGLSPLFIPSLLTRVDRIDFSNDFVSASPRGPLSLARSTLAATGNSNYGWFCGGYTSPVTRIDFSNDSATASSRGSLTLARIYLAATGNSNYGWFGGGLDPSSSQPVGRTDRVDFSNDSVTASLRLFFTARRGLAASGNSNYGWFSGGFPSLADSVVERINFSNDTTVTPRGPLVAARAYMAATSNTPIG